MGPREFNVKAKDMEGASGACATALLRAMSLSISADAQMIYHRVTCQGDKCRETDWLRVSQGLDLDEWSVSSAEEE